MAFAATVFVDDAALVRAPRWLVDRRLADVAGWPRWWQGARAVGDHVDDVHHLRLTARRPWRPAHVHRVSVRPWGHRSGLGLHLSVRGDVAAAVEFWLEDDPGGTVVHHLAHVDAASASTTAWGPLVRRALWCLDERLVPEVRAVVLPPLPRPPASPGRRLPP